MSKYNTDGSVVGYGNPPDEKKFQPGLSGNPKGRPPSLKNPMDIFVKVLNEPVTMMEGGTPVEISSEVAPLLAQGNKALTGDPSAFEIVFTEAVRLGLIKLKKDQKQVDDDIESQRSYITLIPDPQDLNVWEWLTMRQQEQLVSDSLRDMEEV